MENATRADPAAWAIIDVETGRPVRVLNARQLSEFKTTFCFRLLIMLFVTKNRRSLELLGCTAVKFALSLPQRNYLTSLPSYNAVQAIRHAGKFKIWLNYKCANLFRACGYIHGGYFYHIS